MWTGFHASASAKRELGSQSLSLARRWLLLLPLLPVRIGFCLSYLFALGAVLFFRLGFSRSASPPFFLPLLRSTLYVLRRHRSVLSPLAVATSPRYWCALSLSRDVVPCQSVPGDGSPGLQRRIACLAASASASSLAPPPSLSMVPSPADGCAVPCVVPAGPCRHVFPQP